eukprot:gene4906-5048_t
MQTVSRRCHVSLPSRTEATVTCTAKLPKEPDKYTAVLAMEQWNSLHVQDFNYTCARDNRTLDAAGYGGDIINWGH